METNAAASTEAPNPTGGGLGHPVVRFFIYVVTCWFMTGIVFASGFATAWTAYWTGFFVGMIQWALMAIIVLPVMLLVLGTVFLLTRHRAYGPKLMRLLVCAIPILSVAAVLFSIFVNPLTPESRLANLLHCKLPSSVKIEKSFFEGGGLSDLQQEYFITGSPFDLETLKLCCSFTAVEATRDSNSHYVFTASRDGFPEPLKWKDFSIFEDDRELGPVFMIISGDKTKAVIVHYTF
jgi:hypothetical protein